MAEMECFEAEKGEEWGTGAGADGLSKPVNIQNTDSGPLDYI